MANAHRGEIEACLDGRPYRLCLTLGALAELEHAFGDTDMLALAERFRSGRISATDALRVIGAGLRGAGHVIDDDAVARLRGENGAAGFIDIVARLLLATFGGPLGTLAADALPPLTDILADPPPPSGSAPAPREERDPPLPFPGVT